MTKKTIIILSTVFLTLCCIQLSAETIEDVPYLQEISVKIPSDEPIISVAVYKEKLYAAAKTALMVIENDKFTNTSCPAKNIRIIKTLKNTLWLISSDSLYKFDGKWKKIADGEFTDLCLHLGNVTVAAKRCLYYVKDDKLIEIENSKDPKEDIINIDSYSETLYVASETKLALFDCNSYDGVNVIDWGQLPFSDIRDIHRQQSRLYVATGKGIGLLRGMSMVTITGEDGLCFEDVTCLADGFEKDMWIGTTAGAIRCVNGEYQYFAADRWLLDNNVNSITADDKNVYIATNKGIGIIKYQPYTLCKKADYYEKYLNIWGHKRLGFVHKLEWDDQLNQWVRQVSDNDCGWTSHYISAMCFKYAVTGDSNARDEAVNSFKTLKWCEEICPVDGFIARAIWANGEIGHKAQGGSGWYPAEWHNTADGKWQWKADTSSDESDAHYYAASIFYDLVADEKEKALAVEHVEKMSNHIIDNGWVLKDLDGKPTRWGRWDKEYFKTTEGFMARGLNGLSALSYMKTTYQLTKNEKFKKAYEQIIEDDYLNNILRQKHTFPPDYIFHSDDRLAFLVYYPLLKYETDPALRSLYFRSLERSFEVERIEHIPWFNFIYGSLTGNDCEAGKAVEHLRQWPLDLIDYQFKNSIRADLYHQKDYVPYSGGIKAMSPREMGPVRWSDDMMKLDGGDGKSVSEPSCWLEAYWMGRYFGFITEPKTNDPKLLKAEDIPAGGAKPYDGPARPPLESEK